MHFIYFLRSQSCDSEESRSAVRPISIAPSRERGLRKSVERLSPTVLPKGTGRRQRAFFHRMKTFKLASELTRTIEDKACTAARVFYCQIGSKPKIAWVGNNGQVFSPTETRVSHAIAWFSQASWRCTTTSPRELAQCLLEESHAKLKCLFDAFHRFVS